MRKMISFQCFKAAFAASAVLASTWFAGCAVEGPVEPEDESVAEPSEGDDSEAVRSSADPIYRTLPEVLPPQPPPASEVCVTIKRGGTGNVTDAFLAGDYVNYMTGSEINMYSGVSTGGNSNKIVVGFDISAIPATATLTSATFSIYKSWSADNATIEVHRATAPWSEATVTRESFNGASDPNAVGSFSGSGTGMKSVSLTGLVQAWRSGAHPNYGIVIEEPPIANHHYFSSESGPNLAPSLEVCYVAASCSDGIQNQGETGLDCGGPCNACPPTCTDGIQNQSELGVDCGGPCPACPTTNIKVAVMNGGWYTDTLRAHLASQPNITSAVQISSCDLATLSQYNAVVLYGNMSCFNPTTFNQYVQNGGGIVATPWIHNNNSGLASLPVSYGGGSSPVYSTGLAVTVSNANDPLLQGVSFVNGNAVGYENASFGLRPGATNAVYWNNDPTRIAAAKWAYGNGRAVYLNFHYVTSDCSLAINYNWGKNLVYNAVRWAGKSVN